MLWFLFDSKMNTSSRSVIQYLSQVFQHRSAYKCRWNSSKLLKVVLTHSATNYISIFRLSFEPQLQYKVVKKQNFKLKQSPDKKKSLHTLKRDMNSIPLLWIHSTAGKSKVVQTTWMMASARKYVGGTNEWMEGGSYECWRGAVKCHEQAALAVE